MNLIYKITTKLPDLNTLLLKVGFNINFSREMFENLTKAINKSKNLKSLKLPTSIMAPFVFD
jgi:hypothetical protein